MLMNVMENSFVTNDTDTIPALTTSNYGSRIFALYKFFFSKMLKRLFSNEEHLITKVNNIPVSILRDLITHCLPATIQIGNRIVLTLKIREPFGRWRNGSRIFNFRVLF